MRDMKSLLLLTVWRALQCLGIPSTVLLDIMLPKIDGYGVCEVIRRRSQVPIIMLTALSDEENQLKRLSVMLERLLP